MPDIYARTRLMIGTVADWAANDLILGNGELAFEVDGSEVKAKVGNGLATFSGSPYLSLGGTGLTSEVNDALALKLNKAGGTMTGSLILPTISGTPAPNQAVTAAWVEANAGVVFASPTEVAAGVVDDKAISPNTLGNAAIASSAGASSANKLIKTNGSGFIDNSFLPFVANVAGVNADYANRYVKTDSAGFIDQLLLRTVQTQGDANRIIVSNADGFLDSSFLDLTASGGAGEENKIVVTNADGYIDTDLLEAVAVRTGAVDAGKLIELGAQGYISDTFINAVTSGGTSGTAFRLPKLDGNGKLSSTFLPDLSIGTYLGTADLSDPEPAVVYVAGDFYISSADVLNGDIDPSWDINDPGGDNYDVLRQDMLIFNGTNWDHIAASASLSTYLPIDGSLSMTGDLALGANKIINLADGADPTDAVAFGQLGTAAFLDAQTSTVDEADDLVLKAYAFGLGARSLYIKTFVSDLNSVQTTGFFGFDGGAINLPEPIGASPNTGGLINLKIAPNTFSQILFYNDKLFIRRANYTNTNTTGWLEVLDSNSQIVTDFATAQVDIADLQTDVGTIEATLATLGDGAFADFQSGPLDETAGTLLAQGAFGLGTPAPMPNDDADDITQTGFYHVGSASANTPFNIGGLIHFETYDATPGGTPFRTQLAISATSGMTSTYVRFYNAMTSNWAAWTRVVTNPVQTTYLDVTENALLTVGAFGLGKTSSVISSIVGANVGRMGNFSAGSANSPGAASDSYAGINIPLNGGAKSIILAAGVDTGSNEITSVYAGGHDASSASWKRILTTDDILSSTPTFSSLSLGSPSLVLSNVSGELRWNGNKVWHAANDGAGSGLDADTLDGVQASQFLQSGGNIAVDSITLPNSSAIREWNEVDTAIDALIPGTTSGGILYEGSINGHATIGIRSNSVDDGFEVISKGSGGGAYNTLCFLVRADGAATHYGPLHMSANKITGLSTPTVGNDAANKAYVDSVAGGAGPGSDPLFDSITLPDAIEIREWTSSTDPDIFALQGAPINDKGLLLQGPQDGNVTIGILPDATDNFGYFEILAKESGATDYTTSLFQVGPLFTSVKNDLQAIGKVWLSDKGMEGQRKYDFNDTGPTLQMSGKLRLFTANSSGSTPAPNGPPLADGSADYTGIDLFSPSSSARTQLIETSNASDTDGSLYTRYFKSPTWSPWAKIWTSENDGAGSELDAGFLNGVEGSLYALKTYVDSAVAGGGGVGSDPEFNTVSIGSTPLVLSNVGGDLTWNGNEVWHAGNDGAGSGLDADLLDGVQGNLYALKTYVDSAVSGAVSGDISVNSVTLPNAIELRQWDSADTDISGLFYGSNSGTLLTSNSGGHLTLGIKSNALDDGFQVISKSSGNSTYNKICFAVRADGVTNIYGPLNVSDNLISRVSTPVASTDAANKSYVDSAVSGVAVGSNPAFTTVSLGSSPLALSNVSGELRWNGNEVWHAGNDGAGSGLDADLLDGAQGSQYALKTYVDSAVAATDTGFDTVTLNASTTLNYAAHAGKLITHTSSSAHTYTVSTVLVGGWGAVGAAVFSIVNDGTGDITLAAAGGVLLRRAGVGTSGSITIPRFGLVTVTMVSTNIWYVSGVGI